jgi:hypothetical protein
LRGIKITLTLARMPAAQGIFRAITRPREGIVRHNDARVVMAEAPAATIHALFEHDVERSCSTRDLKRRSTSAVYAFFFSALGLPRASRVAADEGLHVPFPLVETRDEVPVKVIKAPNLARADPSKIRDHSIL